MRIGFLFNNRSYKLWHAAPVAFELSQQYQDYEIVIMCADQKVVDLAQRISSAYPGHHCRIELIKTPVFIRVFKYLLKGLSSPSTDAAMRWNEAMMSRFDAMVVPDLTCLDFRNRKLPGLKMIFTKHGAGDRAQVMDPRIPSLDFVLLPGPKLERRLKAAQLIRDDHYAIVGYIKFDLAERLKQEPRGFFRNDLPVILYNPHFDPALSSWKAWGTKVLDFFADNPERYNLIFAPHLKLFERWIRYGARLPRRFRYSPNIHIDPGSDASEDMTYIRKADIYLGDVSSQVYEFLYKPRPCLFLDPRGINWEQDPNYAHWHFGPVVRDINDLGVSLDNAINTHHDYLPAQVRGFADTFDLTSEPPAVRAATAIHGYLARCRQNPDNRDGGSGEL